MYRSLLLIMLSVLCRNAFCQQSSAFRPLRYDEDYLFLQSDTGSGSWYKNTKYLPLTAKGDRYVSFGGDLRMQYFNVKNEGWGEQPPDHDGYLFSRWLAHAD